jgi:hypothetical protein
LSPHAESAKPRQRFPLDFYCSRSLGEDLGATPWLDFFRAPPMLASMQTAAIKTTPKPTRACLSKSCVLASIVLLAFLLAGCASAHITLCGGGLTRQQLERDGLSFGGVTALGEGEFVGANSAADDIQQRFQATRPWLNIESLAQVRQWFAADEYQRTLKQLSEAIYWSPADVVPFERLGESHPYLLLVNIRGINEHGYAHANYSDLFAGMMWAMALASIDEALFHGAYLPLSTEVVEIGDVKGVVRKVEVTFCIFDLRAKQLIWLASVVVKVKSSVAHSPGEVAPDAPPRPPLCDAIEAATKLVAKRLPK